MSVSNGQTANATTFNNAFVSRTTNTDTVGKVDLANTDVASGSTITNVQRELNKLNSFLGSTINTAKDATPSWANNEIGLSTDHVKQRADLITAKFAGATGHTHSGVDGEGPQISASVLADFNQYFVEWQTDVFASAAGLNDDVTTVFTGLTPGGGASAVGVPTTAPYNKVELRTDPSGDQIEEPGGRKVYGRVTESSGTWTLTYYYEDALGVETAYSLPSQDIRIYWREVFNASTRPTFGTDDGFIGSFDATADIVDATASVAGKVSTSAQTFGGEKTFQDGAVFSKAISIEKLDVASAATITALSSANSFVKITGALATELQGVSAPSTAKRVLIYNASTGDLTVKNENAGASAANRILTADASDLVVAEKSSVELLYDTSSSRWRVVSTSGGGGRAVQESIGTGDGVTTSFGPLTYTPTDEDSILVLVNGVVEDESLWSYSGGNILFSTAPAAAQKIYVYYQTSGSSSPLPSPSGIFKVEFRTISAGEATAKQLTLVNTPASASDVMVDVKGGSCGFYSEDYTITGAVLDWSGLGYDGLLSSGDKLRIAYVY